jgi:hypothetical protein
MTPANHANLAAAASVPLPGALERKKTKRLLAAVWMASILIAALHCWAGRYSMNPDGVAYLDASDAFRRGDWKTALNRFRSPFYPWMLTPALALTQSSPESEFPAVHAVNSLIFLVALFCFHFLLSGVVRTHPESAFPEWALVGAAYAVFLWSALTAITLELVTPDLCVAAAVYATIGILLRIRKSDDRWAVFFVLGLTLGIGYLIKIALLAFAPLIGILCAAAIGNVRRAIPRLGLTAAGFVIVAAPWIYALSGAKGVFTVGDSGKFVYGIMVQGVPAFHWHGGPLGNGVPAHPDRQIYSQPNAYEFATPISSTYPPNYDYSYWDEGMIVRTDVATHLRCVARSLRQYFTFFEERLSGVVSIVVLLWLVGERGSSALRKLAREWRLLIPAAYGFGAYAQVSVEWRFLGAYATLLLIALLCSLRIPEFERKRQVTGAAAVAIMVVLGCQICAFSYTQIRQSGSMLEHLAVARSLRALPLGPGSSVAVIGDGNSGYWARLARVRIVAEIPLNIWDSSVKKPDISDVDIFWAASAEEKAAVMRKLAETGAKVAIARDVPPGQASSGWQRIVGTAYSVYHLR